MAVRSKKKPSAAVQLKDSVPATTDVKRVMRAIRRLHDQREGLQAKIASLNTKEEELRDQLNDFLTKTKSRSVKTDLGTFSRTYATVAKVEDPIAFFTFAVKNKAWGLLRAQTSAIAVQERESTTGKKVPGVTVTKIPTGGRFTPSKR